MEVEINFLENQLNTSLVQQVYYIQPNVRP